MIHKEYLKKKNGTENEIFLFHGTKNNCVDSICKYGFNRSYCGTNGIQNMFFLNLSFKSALFNKIKFH